MIRFYFHYKTVLPSCDLVTTLEEGVKTKNGSHILPLSVFIGNRKRTGALVAMETHRRFYILEGCRCPVHKGWWAGPVDNARNSTPHKNPFQ